MNTTLSQIKIILKSLYEEDIVVMTDAGFRLTYSFLRLFMKSPMAAFRKAEDMCFCAISSSNSSNHSSSNSTALVRNVAEIIAQKLAGSKKKKWVTFDEIISNLIERGYTIITTTDNGKKDSILNS